MRLNALEKYNLLKDWTDKNWKFRNEWELIVDVAIYSFCRRKLLEVVPFFQNYFLLSQWLNNYLNFRVPYFLDKKCWSSATERNELFDIIMSTHRCFSNESETCFLCDMPLDMKHCLVCSHLKQDFAELVDQILPDCSFIDREMIQETLNLGTQECVAIWLGLKPICENLLYSVEMKSRMLFLNSYLHLIERV